jgi:hypothetical protein
VIAQLPAGKKTYDVLDANFPWPPADGSEHGEAGSGGG